MEEKQKVVCVAGCVGAGKTTFVEFVRKCDFDVEILNEEIESHPLFHNWQQTGSHVFEMQIEFYVRFVQLLLPRMAVRNRSQVLVVDHSLAVHHHVYSKHLRDQNELSESEFQMLEVFYEKLTDSLLRDCDLTHIILDVQKDSLSTRLRARNRDHADEIHQSALPSLCNLLEEWARHEPESLLLNNEQYELLTSGEPRQNGRLADFLGRFSQPKEENEI